MTNFELRRKEAKLREWLVDPSLSRWSSRYARLYHAWFLLREEGVQRGIFRFFVPSKGDDQPLHSLTQANGVDQEGAQNADS